MEIFKAWPKIPRVENRKEFYTEKLDGTNACIVIDFTERAHAPVGCVAFGDLNGTDIGVWAIYAQSRNRLIIPEDDNFGFAKWVEKNANELLSLGGGYHYGEWWGQGIGRTYDMKEKVFSLFNTKRWGPHNPNTPACCRVVPTIRAATTEEAKQKLIEGGSLAAPGYMNVEGVVVYECNTDNYWKAIINK
jgi:hypothetical protein